MKKYVLNFVMRGLLCASGGPLVLAIVYGILGATGVATALTPHEVCMGIITVSLLAFIAAGCTSLYQIERLSVFMAALIHGCLLYATYVIVYLINGWLAQQWVDFLVFTGIFATGYSVIWLIIMITTKHSAKKLNEQLK